MRNVWRTLAVAACFAVDTTTSINLSQRRPRRIAIVGGGPGGLTLANALLETGNPGASPRYDEVTVFDRFGSLQAEVGGGIQINGGAAVLARLGFLDALKDSALPMARVVSRTASGRKLLDLDVAAAARADPAAAAWLVVRDEALLSPSSSPGAVMSFTIMREALMALLYAPLPAGTVQFGKQVARIEHRAAAGGAGPMACVFADGSEAGGYDLVVGCDGINSKVREWVVGEAEAAAYSGLRVRIGVAPAGNRPDDAAGEMRQFFSDDGAYALTATYGGGAGGPCEMVALTTYDEGAAVGANPLWDSEAVQADCVRRLDAAGMPNEVTAVANAATRFFDIGVRFSNPLLPWTRSEGGDARAVLLGDAAHAMPPFLGQGANQALQDAFCLANELKRPAGLRQALWRYELIRKPPTALLMLESRFLGAVETQRGAGAVLRDAFFWTTDKLGVAKFIFLKGAVPRVPKE